VAAGPVLGRHGYAVWKWREQGRWASWLPWQEQARPGATGMTDRETGLWRVFLCRGMCTRWVPRSRRRGQVDEEEAGHRQDRGVDFPPPCTDWAGAGWACAATTQARRRLGKGAAGRRCSTRGAASASGSWAHDVQQGGYVWVVRRRPGERVLVAALGATACARVGARGARACWAVGAGQVVVRCVGAAAWAASEGGSAWAYARERQLGRGKREGGGSSRFPLLFIYLFSSFCSFLKT
jgi:hypothetical protein